jgi:serine/threonine protein kinase
MASHRMESLASVPWEHVAVKHFRPNALDLRDGRVIRTYDDVERYCEEIKVLIHLRQASPETSNVLYLFEYFMDGSDIFAVTELLGQDLEVWRQECPVFTERMAIEICRSILGSLKFISERNVLHRDIKPQNVLFQTSGDFKSLKLVDFGLSRILGEHEQARDFCGSVGYIAPEIYSEKGYRFEVDMFSFGVLLFRLLSGERPFPNANSQILRRHTLEYRYKIAGTAWENVSVQAKDLIRKLLIDKEERLTAEQALAHPWFSAQVGSILRKTAIETDVGIVDSRVLLGTIEPSEAICKSIAEIHPRESVKGVDLLDKPSIVLARCENDGRGSIWKSIIQRFRSRITAPLNKSGIDSAATSTPSSLDGSTNGTDPPPMGTTGHAHRRAMSFCIVPSPTTPPTHRPCGRSMVHRMQGSILKKK